MNSCMVFCSTVFLTQILFCSGITLNEFITLNGEQKLKLDELRSKIGKRLVKDYTKQDQFLLRYLSVTDFNVDAAGRMLVNNLKWRKDNNIDNILLEDFSDLDADLRGFMEGCDKEGHPILILPLGDWDFRLMVIAGKSQRVLRYVYYLTEETIDTMNKLQAQGVNVTHINIVFDALNINIQAHGCALCIPLYAQIIGNFQIRYPGYVNKAVTINAPEFLIPIWNYLKVFNPKISKLLEIFGKNRMEWQRYMRTMADASALSKKYGGEREEPIDSQILRRAGKEHGVLYNCTMLASDLYKFEENEFIK